MPSRRPCAKCGRLGEPGQNVCANCASGWDRRPTRSLGSDWRNVRNAYLRDNPTCATCGERATEVDHVLNRARGGTDHPDNLQSLCSPCHKRKTHIESMEGRQRSERNCAQGRRG